MVRPLESTNNGDADGLDIRWQAEVFTADVRSLG